MKLTVCLKLRPDYGQALALRETLVRANAACEWISREAWQTKTFEQYRLHRLVYYRVRERFGLSSQMAVRVIAKVAHAYARDTKARRRFKPLGAVAYDDRILAFKPGDRASLWTLAGRLSISFTCSAQQRELLASRRGEVNLIRRRGAFYLACACEVDVPEVAPVEDVLGVDLGIVNLATTSDGERFTGAKVERVRVRHAKLRRSLQQRADRMKNRGDRPKNVRRRLKRLAGREARYRRDTNHCISKRLVALAQGTSRAIALEDLEGIGGRIRFGREQRARLGGWAFAQLGAFVAYKAARAGVEVRQVDPRYTSQTCAECGHCERANRVSQAEFVCRNAACGHRANADVNAARNIRARAAVNQPQVAESHRDTLVA